MLGWAGCTVRDFILSSGFKVRIASLTENQLIIKTHSLSLSHTQTDTATSSSLLATTISATATRAASSADLKWRNYVRSVRRQVRAGSFQGRKVKF